MNTSPDFMCWKWFKYSLKRVEICSKYRLPNYKHLQKLKFATKYALLSIKCTVEYYVHSKV